jgi:hypothetical protein
MDARNINIENKGHLEQLIFEIDGYSNKNRKAEAWKLFECLEDNQRPYVLNELAKIYPETFQKFRIGDINITGKAIHKKAKAYKQNPKRELKNEKETLAYNDLLEEAKASRAFKEADIIFNAHKYVALWVNYINPKSILDSGKYNFQALAPYEYDLLRNPLTGEPLIFILHYPDTTITGGDDGIEQVITESQKDTAAESKIYSIWSKDKKVKVRRIVPAINGVLNVAEAKLEIIETVENELKRLPVAFLSRDLAVDYPLPSQLANKSVDWNVGFSDLKTAASAQGHGQLVIEHPNGQAIETPHLGKHTAILLPQSNKEKDAPTKASYINANPDLAGQLSVLKFDLMNILDDEGITSKSAIEGGIDEVKSGYDRLLKEADVQDIIEDNQSLYASLENEVYLIVKATEDGLNKKTFTSDKLSITFEKPKVMISDTETLANIEKREQLGLLKAHEKHIIINPNLGEEQARQREEEIQAEKTARVMAMQAAITPSEENDAEEDAEEEVENEEESEDVN